MRWQCALACGGLREPHRHHRQQVPAPSLEHALGMAPLQVQRGQRPLRGAAHRAAARIASATSTACARDKVVEVLIVASSVITTRRTTVLLTVGIFTGDDEPVGLVLVAHRVSPTRSLRGLTVGGVHLFGPESTPDLPLPSPAGASVPPARPSRGGPPRPKREGRRRHHSTCSAQ
jgi:hypothetical protein